MRKRVHESVSEIVEEEETEDSVITGWVLVFEAAHPDGRRSITYLTADATGENPAVDWHAEGWLHHILHNQFFDVTED